MGDRIEKLLSELGEWISDHRGDIVDFCKKYMSYRSTPRSEEEAEVQTEFIAPFFRNEMAWSDVSIVDISTDVSRPNVNAIWKGAGGGVPLLLNGHSDVQDASPEDLERWSTDPWDPVVKQGHLYGRGAVDMKGPNSSMFWAVKALMNQGVQLRGDLVMSIVLGEESGEQEIGTLAATEALKRHGYQFPFCINAEPSNCEIHIMSSGAFAFEIDIIGREVHVCMRNLIHYPQPFGVKQGTDVGVDAVALMVRVWERLQELEHEWNMRYRHEIYGGGGFPIHQDAQGIGPIALNVTVVRSGTIVYSISGWAKMEGVVYYPPFVSSDELVTEMKEAINSVCKTSDWLKRNPPQLKINPDFNWPPFKVDIQHPGCKVLASSFEQATGRHPIFSAFKAVNDLGYLQHKCSIDGVTFGPGDLADGAHGPDENISIDQLIETAKVYSAMIINWCQLD